MENAREKLDEVLSIFINARSRLELLAAQYKYGINDENDLIVNFILQALNDVELAGYLKYKREKEAKQMAELGKMIV